MKVLLIDDVHAAGEPDIVTDVAASKQLEVAEKDGYWSVILEGRAIFSSLDEDSTRDVMHTLVGILAAVFKWTHRSTWHIRMSRVLDDTFHDLPAHH